jgi:propionyl-CoA carboxylase alpha chain
MLRAIREYRVNGVKTTLSFGAFAIDSAPFRSGDFDTNFVAQHFTPDKLVQLKDEEAEIAALLSAKRHDAQEAKTSVRFGTVRPRSAWQNNRM